MGKLLSYGFRGAGNPSEKALKKPTNSLSEKRFMVHPTEKSVFAKINWNRFNHS
ncbi:hypothetical protein JXO59_04090 [candidate division KSB1 bacterium]|nr:hypothetical protein [candidate division KSB1 bacterium]